MKLARKHLLRKRSPFFTQRRNNRKCNKRWKKSKELGVGIHAITKEERSERCSKTNLQKWMCLETGFITNAGTLSRYQRARGIDTTKRIRIE